MSSRNGPVPRARLTARVGTAQVTVTACGFSFDEAQNAARDLLHTMRGLERAVANGPPPALPGDRVLSLADFTPDTDDEDEDGRAACSGVLTRAIGAVSGLPYAVPAEIVLPPLSTDRALVGTAHGTPGAGLAGRAVADVLATDIVVRWWRRPRPVLARLPARPLLPDDTVAALAGQGLEVEAYTWTNLPFTTVLAVVHAGGGAAAGFGAAVGPDPRAALRGAFLKAQTARSASGGAPGETGIAPWPTARVLAAWCSGPAHLELLHGHVRDGGAGLGEGASDWVEQAYRRFGHEPLIASWTAPDGGTVVRALCPGAAIYAPVPAARPACPV
ncbi:YcaO-like family protein [Microbispora sp. NPDC049125]|uniref:YcaO-like family protein n=1 Tax=Microbispora sp. NPDC049125 TaxID=3154929 RepID=UPI0034657F73